jgi:hypothetical protein
VAKKKDLEGWLITAVVVGLGLAFLYYARAGLEKENDAALIPNKLEEQIDILIGALNQRFGKNWVEFGLGILEHYVQNALPSSLVILVGAVAEVENISKRRFMTGYDKRRLAAQLGGGIC